MAQTPSFFIPRGLLLYNLVIGQRLTLRSGAASATQTFGCHRRLAMDRVKKLDIGIKPEAAVSGAAVIESEYSTFLTFNAMRPRDNGQYEDAGTAVIEFVRAIKSQFGHPNDEALGGHPLTANGLSHYDVFEIEDSSWLKTVCDQNSVCFPNATWFGDGLRHFVFTFHDSTFECLADDLKVNVRTEPYRTIIAEICERIASE